MKPFHYNQDPLYAAAASILTGQQQLTEEVVAFKNEGFKLVNGLMSDKDIHNAVNSTIKSAANKLSDSTWDVVTEIYGKREFHSVFHAVSNGAWTGDWILKSKTGFPSKGGGAWLTIKDGGPFKAHDSISSVLSFFKIEEEMEDEEMEEAKGDEFASLIGKKVHHGSPGYPTPEVIASITPHQTQSGKFEIEFESGAFDVLSMDDLDELMNGAEVHFKSPHGGITVIELKEDEEMEEAKNNLKSLSLDQLKSQLASLDNQIGRLEDKQGFAPEELKAEFRALDAEIQLRKQRINKSNSDEASLSLDELIANKKKLDNQIGYLEDKQGFAPEKLKAEFRAIDAEIQLRKGMKEGITEDMGISWELIRSMYVKDLVDVVLGLAIGGGAALAGMATLKIKKFIDDKKEDMKAAKEANLVKSALDKIKKDKEASSLLAAIKTAKDNKETKELKSQYRARLNTLLSDDELGMLSGVYSTSLKEGDEGFYSQKMIKNQLQTIVRNSNTCLEMIGAGREFPEWAQSEIAVAEDGIVSVTEFMQSHNSGDKTKIAEAGPETKYTFINAIRHAQKMGNTSLVKTTTSNFKAWAIKNKAMDDPEVLEYVYDFDKMDESAGRFKMGTATITAPGHKLDGKHVHIFHKFDDGRINVQYPKSDKKGDVLNITLTKGQYKLDDEAMSEEYTIKTDAARAVMDKFTMLDAVELEDFLKAASIYFAEEGESEGAFTNLAELFGKAAKAWSNR